jgi:uncharacterized phage protein gp47/JayE
VPPTLQDLLQPVTSDTVKAVLISALSGIGPVQQIGQGAGVMVVSGNPNGNYDAIISIAAGGAPGAATFSYSLDDGTTINGPYTIPSTGAYPIIGTNLLLNFAGIFDEGDEYLFGTVWPPFPVTNWESGGPGRTFLEGESTTVADLAGNALPSIAGGGFNDYANDSWLPLLAYELYQNSQYQPTPTVGLVQVSLAATATTRTFAAGQLVVADGAGSTAQTYNNVSGFTITPGQTLSILFVATQPGSSFNVANGTILVLQTAIAGLSVNNPAPGISGVTHTGSGSGSVSVSGTPDSNYSVVVSVLSTGAPGVGTVQVSLDGGNNYASPFTIPAGGTYSLFQLDGITSTGLVLTFAGTFTATDTYSFTAYSQWVLVAGTDLESVPALQARNSNKWTALGYGGGTGDTFDYLARSTPSGGSEVTQVSATPSTSVAGQFNVVVAGYNGPVSSSALSNITTYIQQRTGLTVASTVSNATTQSVPVAGNVFVPAAQIPAAQAAIATAFQELQAATPIGGIVYWSDILEAVDQKQSGVRNAVLTSPSPNTDTSLASTAVPAFSLTGLNYIPI